MEPGAIVSDKGGATICEELEGFDVVNFTAGSSPECSGLCCSSLANELHSNAHCLFSSVAEAETMVNNGAFNESEPDHTHIRGLLGRLEF
jgi:hypothetical protein